MLKSNKLKIGILILVLALLVTGVAAIAYFTDRANDEVKISVATFTKDGYTITREYKDMLYIANEDIDVKITEGNEKDDVVYSNVTMSVKWVSPDSTCSPFGNENTSDNATISIGGETIDYTVNSDGTITFTLPEHEIPAESTQERTLKFHIPDSLQSTGYLEFTFDGVKLTNTSGGGFSAEFSREDLNAEEKLDFDARVVWDLSPTLGEKDVIGYLESTNTEGEFGIVVEKIEGDGDMYDWPDESSSRQSKYKASTVELTLKEGVTSFGDHAFHDFTKITKLTLPESTKKIGDSAFENISIPDLTVPANVAEFGQLAFGHIEQMTEVTFNHTESADITFPTAGAGTGAFYVYPYVDTIINGTNTAALAYDWIKDLRNPPTLAEGMTWHDSDIIARSGVTSIHFVTDYTVTGNEDAVWNAAIDRDGDGENDDDILCYLNGTVVTVYAHTAPRIYANENSRNAFMNFTSATSISGLSMLDTSKVTTMENMFAGNWKVTELDVENWDTSKVTNFVKTFSANSKLTSLNVSNWDTGSATNMSNMFDGCATLTTLDVSQWDTQKVTNMFNMFANCTELTELDLSTESVEMPANANNSDARTYMSWDTSSVEDMRYMFYNCEALTDLDVSTFDTRNVKDMQGMFQSCSSLETVDLSPKSVTLNNGTVHAWDTKTVESMYVMFKDCISLTELDLSGWDTSGIGTGKNASDDDFIEMFLNCTSLKTLNVSRAVMTGINGRNYTSWDTSNAVHMTSMFKNCTSLESLDLKNWTNTSAEQMGGMFNNCSAMTAIDLTNFTTPSVTYMSAMFYNCSSLEEIDVSSFDTSNATHMYNTFSYCSSLSELDLSNWDTSKVSKNYFMRFAQHCTSLTDITLGQNFGSEANIPAAGSDGLFYVDTLLPTTVRGFNDVMYNYGWATDHRAVTFEGPVNIEVTKEPNKTVYSDGEDFDPTGMEVTIHYGDGTSRVLEDDEYEILDAEKMPAGKGSITISYKEDGKTMTAVLEIQVGYLVTYDANGGTFDDSSKTNDVIYSINPSKVTLISKTDNILEDGTAEEVNYGVNKTLTDVVRIPGASALEVTITYQTENTNYDWVAVYDGSVTPSLNNYSDSVTGKIGGTTQTTQTFTIPGDTAQFFFRSDGSASSYYGYYAVVKGIGEPQVISGTYKEPSSSTASSFEGWYLDEDCTTGNEFDINELTGNITVYANMKPSLTALAVTTPPNTTKYLTGSDFDKTGMVVTATYSDGSTKVITNYTVTDGTNMPVGQDKITVSYTEDGVTKTATTPISVAPILTKIEVTTPPDTTKYLTGSDFDKTGMVVTATYSDGSTKVITDYTVTDGTNMPVGQDKITVSYTEDGVTKTATTPISVVDPIYQAIYSADDESLTFIYDFPFTSGDTYNGKAVTEVFTGFTTLKIADRDSREEEAKQIPWYDYNSTIQRVVFEDVIQPISTAYWFYGFSSCTTMDLAKLDTSTVTDMSRMFSACRSLTSLDVSNFDTSNVTDMSGMFSCGAIITGADDNNAMSFVSLDVSNFDTSSVTSMSGMFQGCAKLTSLDLSGFNTSNVTDMHEMFIDCRSLTSLDVSNFDTSSVTSMSNMFSDCRSLTSLDVSSFDTSNVTNMYSMFYYCSSLTSLDVSSFDTSNVTNMYYMFIDCRSLTSLDVSNFDTSNVTDMSGMFRSCSKLTTIYASELWSTNSVTTSTYMFYNSSKLVGGNGTRYNMNNVTATYAKIDGINGFGYLTYKALPIFVDVVTPDGSKADPTVSESSTYTVSGTVVDNSGSGVKSVTVNGVSVTVNNDGTWSTDITLTKDVSTEIKVVAVNNVGNTMTVTRYVGWYDVIAQAIYSASDKSLTFVRTRALSAGGIYNLKKITAVYTGFETTSYSSFSKIPWYQYSSSIKSVVFEDEIQPINTKYWFYRFYNCTSMDLTKLNTSNVTSMSYMFQECTDLASLDVTNFDTSNVTSMSYMFQGCAKLTSLDLSGFDTSNVTGMSYMFSVGSIIKSMALETIYVSDLWSTENVTSSLNMFNSCTNLVGGNGTVFDSTHIDATYAKIDGGTADPGYFTASAATTSGDSLKRTTEASEGDGNSSQVVEQTDNINSSKGSSEVVETIETDTASETVPIVSDEDVSATGSEFPEEEEATETLDEVVENEAVPAGEGSDNTEVPSSVEENTSDESGLNSEI